MKTITFGIANTAAQRARMKDIMAKRVGVPPDDPKVWFASVASAREVFADETAWFHQEIRAKYGVLAPAVATAVNGAVIDGDESARAAPQFKIVRMERGGVLVTDEALADRIVVEFD